MPTFIDESGETGCVSPYFRLAAVWLPTLDAVEAYREAMQEFQLGIGLEGYEFKSSKSISLERRLAYFQAALAPPSGSPWLPWTSNTPTGAPPAPR